jgi:hypothetical protein
MNDVWPPTTTRKLFFIFYFLFLYQTDHPATHSHYSTSQPSQTMPTMQMHPINPTFNVRSTSGVERREESSRMTRAGVALLSHESDTRRVLNTEEDIRACDSTDSRRGLGRNQGVIDKRCKAVRGRLHEKVRRRTIQRQIDQLDTLMQKLLETQEPANEKMYDLYAQRKAQLEAQL